MAKVEIIPAEPKHAGLLLQLIKELATYERRVEDVVLTEKELEADLTRGAVYGLLLLEDDHPAAYTMYCYTYDTWYGQQLHMEDIYVRETHRRKGHGLTLWKELALIAEKKGCKDLLWKCLDWNEPAIKFYKTMPCEDGTEKEGWKLFRMNGEGIKHLAHGAV